MRSYYPGITDVEMKIVLDNVVPTSLDSYFKDVSDDDVSKTKESAYHETLNLAELKDDGGTAELKVPWGRKV